MRKYKQLSCVFATLAVLLSNVMWWSVGYSYCALQWGGRYECYSAPPSTAFVYCIPYGIGIVICVILAWSFNRKGKKTVSGRT